MQKYRARWVTKPIQGKQLDLRDGTTVLAGRLVEAAGGGPLVKIVDNAGKLIGSTLVRPSGTESLVRHYMEKVEPFDDPRPRSLAALFRPFMFYLGLDKYHFTEPDGSLVPYPDHFAQMVSDNYAKPLERQLTSPHDGPL